jgi:hypothetical protein
MTITGGKRKINKSLKAWVTFVKKVQKEEKISYKDAIHRAKQRKDKGEKWMTGGANTPVDMEVEGDGIDVEGDGMDVEADPRGMFEPAPVTARPPSIGGRRRRRTMRRSRGRSRGRGRTRSRASRRH